MMRASSADVPGLGFDLWAAENRALNLYRKKGTRPEGYRERLCSRLGGVTGLQVL